MNHDEAAERERHRNDVHSCHSNCSMAGCVNARLRADLQCDERERTSYLTADELQAAQKLHQRAPYALCSVSEGFFSIARHYGGCTFQGCHYTYMPWHDECVRDDVLKLVRKMRRQTSQREAPAPQPGLDFGA